MPSALTQGSTLATICFILLVVFLIIFPKGGIKAGGLPLTFGYALIMLTGGLAFLGLPLRQKFNFDGFMLLLCLVPFQAIIVSSALSFNTPPRGIFIALLISFFVLPIVFYVALLQYVDDVKPGSFRRWYVWALRLIAAYGILLFFYKYGTGQMIEVPYLTVNLEDVGTIESRMNSRGEFMKLVSTYNNGNIYAACLAILFPVYYYLEKNPIWVLVVVASMILTLSRTGWLLLAVLLVLVSMGQNINVKVIVRSLLMLMMAAVGIAVMMIAMGQGLDWLLDSGAGGRVEIYDTRLDGVGLFPQKAFGTGGFGFGEVAYLGVIVSYGLGGLPAFLLAMFAPIAIGLARLRSLTGLQRHALLGLIAYAIANISDGAMLLIPSMALFYGMAVILFGCNRIGAALASEDHRLSYARRLREALHWKHLGHVAAPTASAAPARPTEVRRTA